MRLTLKIAIAFTIGFATFFPVRGYLEVSERLRDIEINWRNDQELVASVIAPSVSRTWRLEGEDAAKFAVSYLQQYQSGHTIRWVDDFASNTKLKDLPQNFRSKIGKKPLSISRPTLEGQRRLYTYVALDVTHDKEGIPDVIEISRALPEQRTLFLLALKHELSLMVTLLLLAVIVALGIGMWFVGRPVYKLANHAEQVGQGDLDARIQLKGSDEFSLLAKSMNKMSERLAESKKRTEREILARETATAQLRHAERLATIGKLASGIAHELGTPLNVIRGRAALVVESKDVTQENIYHSEIVIRQVDRIIEIIQALLNFARPAQGEKEIVDVNEIIDDVCELLSYAAKDAGLSLVCQTSKKRLLIYCNRNQIHQVITNLVMNATQASTKGTIDVRTCIHADDPSKVEISVKDEGAGIPQELLPKIFDPFFTTKDIGQGTGLGLSVTYGIVKEHNGEILVESEENQGTRFRVLLPLNSNARPGPGNGMQVAN